MRETILYSFFMRISLFKILSIVYVLYVCVYCFTIGAVVVQLGHEIHYPTQSRSRFDQFRNRVLIITYDPQATSFFLLL